MQRQELVATLAACSSELEDDLKHMGAEMSKKNDDGEHVVSMYTYPYARCNAIGQKIRPKPPRKSKCEDCHVFVPYIHDDGVYELCLIEVHYIAYLEGWVSSVDIDNGLEEENTEGKYGVYRVAVGTAYECHPVATSCGYDTYAEGSASTVLTLPSMLPKMHDQESPVLCHSSLQVAHAWLQI